MISIFTRETMLLIEDAYLIRSNSLEFLTSYWFILLFYNHVAFFHKMLIDVLEMRGLLVDYCNVFINSLDSHSNDTHSLQRSHWWASDQMQNFVKSPPMKKLTHLHLGWPEGEYSFSEYSFFWLNYSFKQLECLGIHVEVTHSIQKCTSHQRTHTSMHALPLSPPSSRATYLLLLLKKGKHFSVKFAFPYAGTGATESG